MAEGESAASPSAAPPEKLVVWELVIANEGAAPREAQVVEIAWALFVGWGSEISMLTDAAISSL